MASKIHFTPGAEGVIKNERPYKKRAIKGPKDAMLATLDIVLAHTADVFHAVVEAISEKYGLDKEEMFEAIRTHPAYCSIEMHPSVRDLDYQLAEEAPAAAAPQPVDELERMMQNVSVSAPQFNAGVAPVQKKKFKIKRAVSSE